MVKNNLNKMFSDLNSESSIILPNSIKIKDINSVDTISNATSSFMPQKGGLLDGNKNRDIKQLITMLSPTSENNYTTNSTDNTEQLKNKLFNILQGGGKEDETPLPPLTPLTPRRQNAYDPLNEGNPIPIWMQYFLAPPIPGRQNAVELRGPETLPETLPETETLTEQNTTYSLVPPIPGRQNAVKRAGEPIEQSDIMYQDDLVCILKPEVKKGIIIWTNFTQPKGMGSLCELGLKTGKQLQIESIDFGRSKIHPYMFFRAPYYSRDIDYTSVETEINSSYGEGQIGRNPRVFIRVDPDRTFVFSSEIRAVSVWYGKEHTMINNSKKTLSKYLEIINNNREIIENVKPGKKILYNLFTSEAVLFPIAAHPKEPFNNAPIQRNSEILVSIPHLTPEYFVLCTP